MKAVIFGAGNIGRGFVAPRLHLSGYSITFIDIQQPLIDELNQFHQFTVNYIGHHKHLNVSDVSAINSQVHPEQVIQAMQEADLIATSIGPHLLEKISAIIAQGMHARSQINTEPLMIVCCENMINATDHLMASIQSHLDETIKPYFNTTVQYANSAVDCIIPTQENSNLRDVIVEGSYEFIIENKNVKKPFLNLQGIDYVDNIEMYIERKLFTVNTGHAAIAYLGHTKQYQTVYEAIQDEDVYFLLKAVLNETARVLIHKYNFNPEEHNAYIQKTIQRFKNPLLSDDIERIIRNPLRKIGVNDRIVQPSKLYVEYFHETPSYLAYLYALVLACDNQRDPEVKNMQHIMNEKGVEQFIDQVSSISRNSKLSKEIITNYYNFLSDAKS